MPAVISYIERSRGRAAALPAAGRIGHKYLERTRGRLLGPDEQVRLVSKVQAIDVTSSRYLPVRVPTRVKAFLTLTDQRLILISSSVRAKRARVLFEWPGADFRFSVTKTKLGTGLIHLGLPGGGRIDFEHIDFVAEESAPMKAWETLDLRPRPG